MFKLKMLSNFKKTGHQVTADDVTVMF